MALPIRQGATHKVVIGPVVAVANGYVPVTNLTLSGADEAEVILHDNGTVVDISGYTFAAITTADGYYHLTLQSDISNTVGHMTVVINDDSLCLPVRQDFVVIDTAIYDGIYADGATEIPANVTKWLGTAAATPSVAGVPEVDLTHVAGSTTSVSALATGVASILDDTGTSGVLISAGTGTGQLSLSSGLVRLSATGVDDIWDEALSGHVAAGSSGAAMYIIRSGTAQAGASTTITLDASASAVDDFYNNQAIFIVSGTGVGQGRFISDYDGTTKVATVATWGTNPDNTSVFVIRPFGSIPGATAPTAAEVADAVWDEAKADHVAEGTFGEMLQGFHSGTAQAGASSSITLDATGSSSTTDYYKYAVVEIISGTGAKQSRQITAYNGTTKVATVDPAWTTTPSTDSNYVIKGLGIDAATIAQIADGVWDEARSGHVTAGTFGEYVLADSTRISGSATAADVLESVMTGGGGTITANISGTVSTVTTLTGHTPQTGDAFARLGAPVGASISADLQTIDTVVDAILADTVVLGTPAGASFAADIAAIKAQTAALEVDTQDIQARVPAALTAGGNIKADILAINGAVVTGDGNATPWDAA